MPRKRRGPFSIEKALDDEVIRANLMTASLYLLSYELLYDCIVRGTKDFFDVEHPPSDADIAAFEADQASMASIHPDLAAQIGEGPEKAWQAKVQQFQEAVGLPPNTHATTKLLRNCTGWLVSRSVFSSTDIQTIERVLYHRHEVAHEIPTLLTEKGFEVEIDLITAIAGLIHRADLFWFRNDWFDTGSIDDEGFVSPRLILFQHIVEAVGLAQ